MVQHIGAALPAYYCILIRPNLAYWAQVAEGLPLLVVALGLVALLASVLVAPGAASLLVGLGLGGSVGVWRHLQRHAGDYERLTLCQDRLILERHGPRRDERVEVNSLWVQMVAPPEPGGGFRYLALRFGGKEIPFGCYLNAEERAQVGREIRALLANLRR
ncbi:MAG: DUF2244 domain-containing protein [Betaproteobacteria bacterium]|nr:DUF2244 domain-containing protein [Betaproteobacteria bacterium]